MKYDYFVDFLMLILSIILWFCFKDSVFLIIGAIATMLAICIVVIDIFEICSKKNKVMYEKCRSCM